jgi:hypothetical protein
MVDFNRAPLGVNPFAEIAVPVGYQPSVKYWRVIAARPETTGPE